MSTLVSMSICWTAHPLTKRKHPFHLGSPEGVSKHLTDQAWLQECTQAGLRDRRMPGLSQSVPNTDWKGGEHVTYPIWLALFCAFTRATGMVHSEHRPSHDPIIIWERGTDRVDELIVQERERVGKKGMRILQEDV